MIYLDYAANAPVESEVLDLFCDTSLIAPASVMQHYGFQVEFAPVNKDGLKSMIRSATILVSVCAVDSGIGIVQPISEIASILKEYPNIYFHTDASQVTGKVNQKERYDYVSSLNKKVIDALSSYSFIYVNNTDKSIPFTINFSVKGIRSKDIVSYVR